MNKFKVATVVTNLGVGGTEKTIQILLSNLDSSLFISKVFCLDGTNLARKKYFDEVNIEIVTPEQKIFQQFIKDFKPHIVHWHRGGWPQHGPFEVSVIEKVPILCETNVFGSIDKSLVYKYVDKSFFVSKFCALKYSMRGGILLKKKHSILYNPIKYGGYYSGELVTYRKNIMGKNYDSILIIELQRISNKWTDMPLKTFGQVLNKHPNTIMAIVGCPIKYRNKWKDIYGENVKFLEELDSDYEVDLFLNSCDIFLNASAVGESFGCAMAEAMMRGKPVIANRINDLWSNNGFLEVIKHMENGIVVKDAQGFADAINILISNMYKRVIFGMKGYEKIHRNYKASIIALQLRSHYLRLLDEKGFIDNLSNYHIADISPSFNEIVGYKKEYMVHFNNILEKI